MSVLVFYDTHKSSCLYTCGSNLNIKSDDLQGLRGLMKNLVELARISE
jgi:hypothetical protein